MVPLPLSYVVGIVDGLFFAGTVYVPRDLGVIYFKNYFFVVIVNVKQHIVKTAFREALESSLKETMIDLSVGGPCVRPEPKLKSTGIFVEVVWSGGIG